MFEKPPQKPAEQAAEKKPERFPSKEEITSVFEKLLNGEKFKELTYREDETGVIVYEIETTAEDGEKVEYNFQKATYDYRDPNLPPGARYSASIHATYYDGEMPVGGSCVANYLDGTWEYPEAE